MCGLTILNPAWERQTPPLTMKTTEPHREGLSKYKYTDGWLLLKKMSTITSIKNRVCVRDNLKESNFKSATEEF